MIPLLSVTTQVPQSPQAVINPPQPPALLSPAQQPQYPPCTEDMPVCPVPAPVPTPAGVVASTIPHYVRDIAPDSNEPAVRMLITLVHRDGDEKFVDLLTNQTRFWQVCELMNRLYPGYGVFDSPETDCPF